MRSARRQRGMSMWGILTLVVVIGFFAIIGMKLIPVYLESAKIDKAMKATVGDATAVANGQNGMIKSLVKRLDIDGVYFINNTASFKENGGKVVKTENTVTMELYYDREIPLFGNLTLVAEFDKSYSN